MANIQAVSERERLTVRRSPYWSKIGTGAYIGFRKMTAAGGTWLLRYREPDTINQVQFSLGDLADTPNHQRYAHAVEQANKLLKERASAKLRELQGESMDVNTISDACRLYVAHVKEHKGETAARDIERRLSAYVLNDAGLAGTELKKLTAGQVKKWLQSLKDTPSASGPNRGQPRTPSTLNRDVTCFRAALNHAAKEGFTATSLPWSKTLKPIPKADKSRQVILTREELTRLIDAADPDVGLLIKALALVPLRPGAMAALTVKDLDVKTCTLKIPKDKTGSRVLHLPPKTIAFFAEQARLKTPDAPLIARAGAASWDKDAWKKPVQRAAVAAGLEVTIDEQGKQHSAVTLYAIRHTTITALLNAGLDVLTVAKLAGTSVRMIEANYHHLTIQHSHQALEKLAF